MPDWSYHCLFKPLLFALPPRTAERLVLRSMGALAGLPGGMSVIEFMGHMRIPPAVRVNEHFPTCVGIGGGFDICYDSARAFAALGCGFVEIGPITVEPVPDSSPTKLDTRAQTIAGQVLPVNRGLQYYVGEFFGKKLAVPLAVRLAHLPGTSADAASVELRTMADHLSEIADFVCIDTRWSLLNWQDDQLLAYMKQATELFERVLILVEPGLNSRFVKAVVDCARDSGAAGFTVAGGMRGDDGTRLFGVPTREAAKKTVKELRALAPDAVLIASGGIMQPADAMAFLDAGANMVALYSGLVFWGPGLPKRINEAINWFRQRAPVDPRTPYAVRQLLSDGWLGFALMGLGLAATSVAAMTVGLTTVILPYDETFMRVPRAAFAEAFPSLLAFMQHDRVTYSGTGLSCGLLFALLAIFGARRGLHWAFNAIAVAGAVGFLSFLLCLGFHYIDPLHAAITLLLLPFFIWGVCMRPRFRAPASSNVLNDRRFINGICGQFLFVCIGAGLVLAGLTICAIATTTVFVPEDLQFMHATAQALTAHNPHLLPAVAHDRAGFGGALLTAGVAVSLIALHGFRQGEGWLWWALLVAGLPPFVATLAIHFFIGYTNFWHLLPVYIGFSMFLAALFLSYQYLCASANPARPPSAF